MQAKDSVASQTTDGDRKSDEVEEIGESKVEDETCSNSNSEECSSFDSIIDVSGKSLDFSALEGREGEDAVAGLYMYKNVFNLIPRSVAAFKGLKTLKFFANEVNLFPSGELRKLVELECLQVKVASPGLNGLEFRKLNSLKELELTRVPPRLSDFPVFRDISGLKRLTKLSVCHFSIRYLPPEIGFLENLEYLDLSFNKMKNLPPEIIYLNSLVFLRVANNKLVEVPPGLSSMQRLEHLDLSNNRLTSLGALELHSMHNLQKLNLQNNKLLSCCQIPSWVCCNLEGNDIDMSKGDIASYSTEMDVLEEIQVRPRNGSLASSGHVAGLPPNNKCFAPRKSRGWKRRYYLQQRARQDRLNSSRKWKSETKPVACKISVPPEDSHSESSSTVKDTDVDTEKLFSGCSKSENSFIDTRDEHISSEKDLGKNSSCLTLESIGTGEEVEDDLTESDASLDGVEGSACVHDKSSSSEVPNSTTKSKRHFDGDLRNPKPSKSRRPARDPLDLSGQYSRISFCSIDDHLPDGFYDAGRDRPFLPLKSYAQAQQLPLDSREVILVDREKDEVLDAIVLRAQALLLLLKQINCATEGRRHIASDNLQIASLLALFVSDHFGGSDKTAVVEKTRKAASGSNYTKPFVCTCPTGNHNDLRIVAKQNLDPVDDIVFTNLCESSLRSVKVKRNSIIVPMGSLQFGVCRHRAILMKYICDRIRVPCELVRGYLDFLPHAWNVIMVKRGNSWIRMIVDACHPHDIREETDPEYFTRYIPLSRINVSLVADDIPGLRSFPSLSACNQIGKAAVTTLIKCKVGSLEAVAKVRTLEVSGTSADEIRNFELSCLGEVRMLGVLKHPCVVQFYGHQILSKWEPLKDGQAESRKLEYAILMEYIKGGSLKRYLDKLSRAGENRVDVELALFVGRDVASALLELHSKHIIHRDIKSENVLLDLDEKRPDGSPTVKLCDFDRAVPLRSLLHTCCIGHNGIPPPDVCVGTPRWMAPEVLRAMCERGVYGLEADIWSFGCLLFELLTLQLPYSDMEDSEIHNFLQMGKRPRLTEDLEAMAQPRKEHDDLSITQSGSVQDEADTESEILRFLVAVYLKCTEKNPTNRPTAKQLYNMFLDRPNSVINSSSLDQV